MDVSLENPLPGGRSNWRKGAGLGAAVEWGRGLTYNFRLDPPDQSNRSAGRAGVAQWQSRSFPSLRRGFDSLHPLQVSCPRLQWKCPLAENAVPTVQIDNDRVRVTEWRFAPGAATGYHRHEFDYLVVPMTTGRLKLIGPDGAESLSDLTAGVSYARQAGVEHDVINANDYEFVFVEVELK